MARMGDLVESEQEHLRNLPLPIYEARPWVTPRPLSECRIAIITTAGLARRGEPTFASGASDYRVIPADTDSADLLMSHVSVNFDRSGFQEDVNVVFPIDRLRELAAEKAIGSVADFHYSFMGATDPKLLEQPVRQLAGMLKQDRVDAVLLSPV